MLPRGWPSAIIERGARQGEDGMAAFLIADVKLTDDSWVPSYAAVVHDIAARHGGRYLARSGNIETIEGEGLDTTLVALIQFPDRASLDAFVNDPDYAPYAKARQEGSVSRFHVIDDTDLAGAIPYLPNG
jgi:uncharacterized protein (DUF1330 family)